MMPCIQVSTHLVSSSNWWCCSRCLLLGRRAARSLQSAAMMTCIQVSTHLVVLQQVLVAGQARGQVPAERGHDDLHPSEHSPGGAAAGACCWAGARPGPCRARP
ncbi:hypothetical protein O0L34_g9385 [Tuta absoluta]|nr:hypothetical protein O0L34_g9385 [Tuta absoluta]